MNGNYKRVIDWSKMILEDDIRSCGLEEAFKNTLYELTLEWEGVRRKLRREAGKLGV